MLSSAAARTNPACSRPLVTRHSLLGKSGRSRVWILSRLYPLWPRRKRPCHGGPRRTRTHDAQPFLLRRNYAWADPRHAGIPRGTADFIDRHLIEGFAVRGVSGITDIFGRSLRLLQTGNLQTYAFLFALGVVIVLAIALRH